MSFNSDEYFHSSKFKKILKLYEDTLYTDSPALLTPDEFVDIAEFYYNNGLMEKAENLLNTTMEIYPGAAPPLLFKARIELLDNNNADKAMEYVEQIEDKTDLEFYYIKAEIMVVLGHPDKADDYLEGCFDFIDDEDRDYFAIDVAAIFLDYALPDKGEKWLARVEDTDIEEYKEQYARITFEKGNYDKTQKLYNELIDKDPYSVQYWNALASAQFLSEDYEGSIRSSEYALAINPDNPAALINKANSLYYLGSYKEAIKYYIKYNKLNPDDINSVMLLGYCYITVANFAKAAEMLAKAASVIEDNDSNLTEIYKEWAYALFQCGNKKACFDVIDRAEARGADPIIMLLARGNMLYWNGEDEKGNACFVEAVKKSNNSKEVLAQVAGTLYTCKEFASAYNIYHFLELSGYELRDDYVNLTICCFVLNKIDEFLSNLKKSATVASEYTKDQMGHLFPKGMPVENYYKYMLDKIEKGSSLK